MELEATTNIEIITGIIIILITLAVALKFTVKEKAPRLDLRLHRKRQQRCKSTKVQKTIEAVQWTGENIQDVWETVRCCATSQEMRILPATRRIEIIWHQGREIAFPGDYFIKPEVSSRLQIIEVMKKGYFEENYRIKQDSNIRNSENGQIRED